MYKLLLPIALLCLGTLTSTYTLRYQRRQKLLDAKKINPLKKDIKLNRLGWSIVVCILLYLATVFVYDYHKMLIVGIPITLLLSFLIADIGWKKRKSKKVGKVTLQSKEKLNRNNAA